MGDSRKYPYHTTDGFKDFRRGGGIHDYGILKAWGGIYDLKSEGMGDSVGWHLAWDLRVPFVPIPFGP